MRYILTADGVIRGRVINPQDSRGLSDGCLE